MIHRRYSDQGVIASLPTHEALTGVVDGINRTFVSTMSLGATKADHAILHNGVVVDPADYDFQAPRTIVLVGGWVPAGADTMRVIAFGRSS